MERFLNDLRFTVRQIQKQPAFSLFVVIVLALGIGSTAATFTFINGILLRPLPYKDPEKLVSIWHVNRELEDRPVSYPNYEDWSERSGSFQGMAAFAYASYTVGGGEIPLHARAASVSASLFPVLGVPAAHGRTFTPEEELAESVVVLSHGIWQRLFAGDPRIVGRDILLNEQPHTVVGVMPEGFYYPSPGFELWTPLAADPRISRRDNRFIGVIARLKPGVSVAQAQSEMAGIARSLEQEYEDNEGLGVMLQPRHEQVVEDVRESLLLLFAAVVFVLLLACMNIANLLLARAIDRRREFAIRTALGAERRRILRQVFTEGLVFSLLGGLAGVFVAIWGVKLILALQPTEIPRLEEIAVDGRALLFTFGVSLLASILFNIVPALQTFRTSPQEELKAQAGAHSPSRRSTHAHSFLLVSEIAVSLLLLVAAALLARSFFNLQAVETGFNRENLLTFRVDLPMSRYPSPAEVNPFYERLLQRLRSLPAVERAGAAAFLPFEGWGNGPATVEGRVPPPGEELMVGQNGVTPDYFETMEIRLLKGRSFTAGDDVGAPLVVIVNDLLARQFWPGRDPLGHRIKFVRPDEEGPWYTIVGVVEEIRQRGLDVEAEPEAYFSSRQAPWARGMTVVLRTRIDALAVAADARRELWAIDKDLPEKDMASMEQLVIDSIGKPRLNTAVLIAFACIALVLALTGIYSVVTYSVSQRTREIGIRMSLGASRGEILRWVVRRHLPWILLGVGLGVAGSLATVRVLRNLLFGIEPNDTLTYLAVSLLMVVVTLLACYLPARRASEVDPVVAFEST